MSFTGRFFLCPCNVSTVTDDHETINVDMHVLYGGVLYDNARLASLLKWIAFGFAALGFVATGGSSITFIVVEKTLFGKISAVIASTLGGGLSFATGALSLWFAKKEQALWDKFENSANEGYAQMYGGRTMSV